MAPEPIIPGIGGIADLAFDMADMVTAIEQLNMIPVRMGPFLQTIPPRITGLPLGQDAVTQRLHGAFNAHGASVVTTTVDAVAKIPGATTAYANVSMAYQNTDTQNAYATEAAAGSKNLLQTAMKNESVPLPSSPAANG